MTTIRIACCAIVCIAAATLGTQAQESPFHAGTKELEVLTGAAVALTWGGIRETYNYAEGQLRLGWMLNTPSGARGLFRGNFELLASTTGAYIYNGPGTKIGTADVLIRYNFVQPNTVLVPYYQTGVGIFVSDISNDRTQSEIGSTAEIDVQSALGLRVLLPRKWSLRGEFIYQHVSNAGLEGRNVGINAIGGLFGLSRSF